MENVDTKKKIKGLPSTIVAGIFLTIAVGLAILLFFMNLTETEQAYMESVKEGANSEENPAGAAVAVGVAGMFGLMFIIILYYGVVVVTFFISHIMLIPVIKNLKHTDNKVIRIINFVYLGIIVTIAIICIIKFILFVTQVG